ncbi:HD-GYP domain-containing protein [Litchfieldia alkalitelluris]|uniref:HD-GYP domain-containing protein n=1 Tax=Litchfieldia alkalitelluris TaxID=304268 RepID=UPI00147669B2|nr:HD domain-containing phosphohydrolase [Litchfieldia alkalitelluris]
MSKSIKLYILILILLCISFSSYWFSESPIRIESLPFFILLMILAEAYRVPVFIYGSQEQVKISWSLVVSISVLIGTGISEAIIINVIGAITCSIYPKRLPLIKTLYNIGSYVLSITLAYSIYVNIVNIVPSKISSTLMALFFIPILYLLANWSINIILLKLVTKNKFTTILFDLLGSQLHHFILFAFIGGIQGYFYKENGAESLILTLILIGVLLYSFKKTAENANTRILELEESNRVSKELAAEIDKTLEQFIHTLTATVDARDPYTYGHSLQVSNYALALATELRLPDEEIETIRIAGLLHDIGKISIPESILFKEGRLSEEEYHIMKGHAAIGEEILSDIPKLADVAKLVGMHHERYNGSGYPRNLKGEEFPIGAHILGVSDTLDAIISNRSYKDERTVEDAMREFDRFKGILFHPLVVDALFSLRERLGEEPFKNSARLVENSDYVGKVKSNRGFSTIYKKARLSRVK